MLGHKTVDKNHTCTPTFMSGTVYSWHHSFYLWMYAKPAPSPPNLTLMSWAGLGNVVKALTSPNCFHPTSVLPATAVAAFVWLVCLHRMEKVTTKALFRRNKATSASDFLNGSLELVRQNGVRHVKTSSSNMPMWEKPVCNEISHSEFCLFNYYQLLATAYLQGMSCPLPPALNPLAVLFFSDTVTPP